MPQAASRALAARVDDLGELGPRAITYNLSYLAATWGLIASAFALAACAPSPVSFAIAFVIVSSRQQSLLNLEHECIHGMFVPSQRWNERIGALLCAYPCGSPFFATRRHHLAHHRTLGTEADPDAPLHRGADKRTTRGLLLHFGLGLLGGYAARVLFERSGPEGETRTRARDRRNLILVQLGFCSALTAAFGFWTYPLLWLAPLATLTTGAHLLRSFCEHALTPVEERLEDGRLVSIVSNPIERMIVAPYFMNYHSEHHLFPWVPSQHLPEVQRRLDAGADAPRRLIRSSYLRAFALHWSVRDATAR